MESKSPFLIALAVVFFLVPFSSFAGGPWAIGKKKGFLQAGFTSLKYDRAYNSEGKSNSIGTEITDNTFQIYSEYGISEKLTLKTILPFKLLENSLVSENLNGLGNWIIGGKYLLVDKKLKFSGGVDISLPTAQEDVLSGLRTGYDALGITPYFSLGSGKQNLYGFVEGGVNLNSNEYSSNFVANLEVGYAPVKNLWIAGFSDVRQSFENGDFQNTDNLTFTVSNLYVNDQSYAVGGFKIAYAHKDKFGVNFSRVFVIASAENVAASLPFNAGVFLKW